MYNPYLPSYQPQQNGITWVQGETGAKSYLVGAGQSVLLMDSEKDTFYIKSCDVSGMPQPLRIFDYTERKETVKSADPVDTSMFITREEFEKRIAEIGQKKGKTKDEQSV